MQRLDLEVWKARTERYLKLDEASITLKPGESVELSRRRRWWMHVNLEWRIYSGQPASSRPAIGLTRVAVRVLPASERARYAEEFSGELRELAQSGTGHLRQTLYGLRQIRGTLPLRFALRSPRRRGAAP